MLKNPVKELIIKQNNVNLLALYSLALDFESGGLYYQLKRTRNLITHSFVDFVEEYGSIIMKEYEEYHYTKDDFEKDLLELFVIVKSAIIYFANALQYDKNLYKNQVANMPIELQKNIFGNL